MRVRSVAVSMLVCHARDGELIQTQHFFITDAQFAIHKSSYVDATTLNWPLNKALTVGAKVARWQRC